MSKTPLHVFRVRAEMFNYETYGVCPVECAKRFDRAFYGHLVNKGIDPREWTRSYGVPSRFWEGTYTKLYDWLEVYDDFEAEPGDEEFISWLIKIAHEFIHDIESIMVNETQERTDRVLKWVYTDCDHTKELFPYDIDDFYDRVLAVLTEAKMKGAMNDIWHILESY